MAKKKQTAKDQPNAQAKEFGINPFSDLRGFAVSAAQLEAKVEPANLREDQPKLKHRSFDEEMERLGVKKIPTTEEDSPQVQERLAAPVKEPGLSEEQLFLQAMGELQVNFADVLPVESEAPSASARRMKQLKQGKLSPEATLDLHGLQRADLVERLQFFLQNAQHQGYRAVLVITGRGLHSDGGEPVLRQETERFLAASGRKWVAEYGRAPKQYGGSGALILFLKKSPETIL
jgi:DNA-nicking Smr family endonuclease